MANENYTSVPRITFAEMLGVHPETVSAWIREGMPAPHAKGKKGRQYDIHPPTAIRWLLEHEAAKAASGDIDDAEGKRRKTVAEAGLRQTRLEKEQSRIVATSLADAKVEAEYDRVRERLLAMPAHVAEAIANETDPQRIELLLKGEITDTLTALSEEEA